MGVKMEVDTESFQLALKKAKPVLETVSGPKPVRIDASEKGICLTARGTNVDIACRAGGSAEGKVSVVVDSQYLYSLVPRIKDSSFSLECRKSQLHLSAGPLSADMIRCGMALCPALRAAEAKELVMEEDASSLAEAVLGAAHALPPDCYGEVMSSFLIEATGDGIRATAMDRYRISRHGGAGEAQQDILIPGNILKKTVPYFRGSVRISLAGPLIMLEDSCTMLALNSVIGRYFNFGPLIKKGGDSSLETDRARLKEAAETAACAGSDKISLEIKESSLSLSAAGLTGNVSFTLPCKAGKERKICLNGRLLTDALKALKGETVHMEYGTDISPVLLTEGGSLEVILPINVR